MFETRQGRGPCRKPTYMFNAREPSMYQWDERYIYLHEWLILMGNRGKYTRHGWYGCGHDAPKSRGKWTPKLPIYNAMKIKGSHVPPLRNDHKGSPWSRGLELQVDFQKPSYPFIFGSFIVVNSISLYTYIYISRSWGSQLVCPWVWGE